VRDTELAVNLDHPHFALARNRVADARVGAGRAEVAVVLVDVKVLAVSTRVFSASQHRTFFLLIATYFCKSRRMAIRILLLLRLAPVVHLLDALLAHWDPTRIALLFRCFRRVHPSCGRL
jgi:hypothetical protein